MASPNNKKLSILYILKILQDYSDENHLLTQKDIAKLLYTNYGMECERKSISSNIDALIDLDYDIIKSSNGCYLGDRKFEPSEIQFLIDAVFSSKSIPSKQSKELATKLSGLLSNYQKKQYKYIYKAEEINRTSNKQLFYTIDIINEAIEKGKKIKFNYTKHSFNKDENKKKRTYIINPYFLVNSQGKYYLVCNYDFFDDIANYKVEKIENVEILDKDIKPVTSLKGYENGIDISKYANEHIYMFSDEPIRAVVKVEDEHAVDVIEDWFGTNARLYLQNNEMFAEIRVSELSLIYWCLQYGESVELISPESTRKKIKDIVDEMAKKYK